MKTRLLTPLVLCFTAMLLSCHDDKAKDDPAKAVGPKIEGKDVIKFPESSPKFKHLVIGEAKAGDVIAKHFYGRITTNEDVTVRVFSPVFGRVSSVAVDMGQQVHAGDVLARLLSPDMGQAQSDAHKAAADVNTKTRIYWRTKDLLDHGATAVKDLDQALNDMEQAKAEKARADVRLSQLYGSPAEILDGTYPLKSPIDGMVVDRNINVGQEIRPDSQLANATNFFTQNFTVTDIKNLWVMVDITERELPKLHPGDKLVIHSTAFPGKKFPGSILKLGYILDPLTRTAKVRGSVENLDMLLKPEIYVNVDILDRENKSGVEVPSKAVLFSDGKNYVFKEISLGVYQRLEVEVGDDHDERASLTKGVSAGDKIVEEGALYLQAIIDNADSD